MNEVVEIPKQWRVDVCRLLDAGCGRVPISVFSLWEEMFQNKMTTIEMLLARVSEALKEDGIKGVRISTMRNEPGEVYEFLLPLEDIEETAYAKVSLRLARNEVFFYSAHRAEREYL